MRLPKLSKEIGLTDPRGPPLPSTGSFVWTWVEGLGLPLFLRVEGFTFSGFVEVSSDLAMVRGFEPFLLGGFWIQGLSRST